ncbi:MAG: DeoR/GlpR family DNA-binding transcription regulator [Candidatus Adiutrix sp.]|jgi:DeoR family glycerol-3-phosphate regulon repressor|nr:DeoR/GlpR family DNA-binding transcription regulator [Candidatus Adiutrix sp.]
MNAAERHKKILKGLLERSMLSVEEISDTFGVSRETARRDLAFLAERKLLCKVHGGAVAMPRGFEEHFQKRVQAMREEKLAACRKALPLVRPGDSLFIDSGTTTLIFAELLREVEDLNILTNSLAIASLLGGRHKVLMLGGWLNVDAAATAGHGTIVQAGIFSPDHAFLSIGGISLERGFTNFTEDDAGLSRVMVRNAAQSTVIADHSKFWKNALVQVCPLGDISHLATDRALPEEFRSTFQQSGVRIL